MKLPPSKREPLYGGSGKRIAVWSETHARLLKLAELQRKEVAVVADEIITAALEKALDKAARDAKQYPPEGA